MLSYRHSFHAGNHADVLKHIVQSLILEKVTQKHKPAIYIDTHAGAGLYDLGSAESLKTNEFLDGVTLLLKHAAVEPALNRYQQRIEQFTVDNYYPGSPLIAASILREQDSMVLVEYHNSEIENLKFNVKKHIDRTKTAVHHRDGYEGLIGILPPTPARGLVLIDPPYEVKDEYQQVLETLNVALKKWSTGIYAIWYPLLSSRAGNKAGLSEKLCQSLSELPAKSVLNVTLQVAENTADAGMYGSGLVIINPPWELDTQLESILPELCVTLKGDRKAKASVEWLKTEG